MTEGPTRAHLEQRLADLKREFATGQQMAAELEQKRASLEQSMLRISGAIQLLEELLDGQGPDAAQPGAERAGT